MFMRKGFHMKEILIVLFMAMATMTARAGNACIETGPTTNYVCVSNAYLYMSTISVFNVAGTIYASATTSNKSGVANECLKYKCQRTRISPVPVTVTTITGYSVAGPHVSSGSGLQVSFPTPASGSGTITMWATGTVARCSVQPAHISRTASYPPAPTVPDIEFKEIGANNGFDDTTVPEWLIVPVNNALNTKTAIAEIDPAIVAPEVSFEVLDTSKATVSPVNASTGYETVTLTGQASGDTALKAKVETTDCKTLNLAVKDKRTVRVAIHFMQDIAGHSTSRNNADAIIDELNICYTPQANVVFTKHSSDSPVVPTDLGSVVELYASNPANEWDDVINAAQDATAEINLYFVWEFECDGTPLTDNAAGGRIGTDAIIEDKDNPHTVCHETGHTLGLWDSNIDERNLMKSGGSGFKIFKFEADLLNML